VSVAALVCVVLLGTWGMMALVYQAPGGRIIRGLVVSLWSLSCLILVGIMAYGAVVVGVTIFALEFAALLTWWHRIAPSNDRDWADDVARMTTGVLNGDQITVRNVRYFDWRTTTDYDPRWETRSYDLRRLSSVDMVLSYWSMSAIAHVLVSFGFDDGDHLVFSVEIRREKTETFSEIGGFFKEFELSILACDERDVIRLRTNVRHEDVYLYRLRMPPEHRRALFLAYLAEANELSRTPRFYNTLSTNCTTLVYRMMRHIVGRLPLDFRLLLSGYLPGYMYRVGALDLRYPLSELKSLGRIGERARQSDRSPGFSTDIRAGIPPAC
jgi:Domain of unknown function (DUF4105)